MMEAASEAATIALKMGSAAKDLSSFAADFGEEFPLIGPVVKTLQAVREKVETVRHNKEELDKLQERCAYFMACVIAKHRRSSSEIDLSPLVERLKELDDLANRCSGRRLIDKFKRVVNAQDINTQISDLHGRISDLRGDLSLVGIVKVEGKVDDMKELLESLVARQVSSA